MDEELCNALVVGAGGAATLVLTPALVAAAGFTAGGITAGSLAAWLMSTVASLSGGGVAAGGLVATLQSVGAAGLSWLGWGATAAAGNLIGRALSSICNQTISSVEFVVEN